MPVIATGVWVGVRVTRQNRQDLDRRYAGFRSLQYFVDEKIVKLGDFAAVETLHFDLAAKMVVRRNRFGPDHAEMMQLSRKAGTTEHESLLMDGLFSASGGSSETVSYFRIQK